VADAVEVVDVGVAEEVVDPVGAPGSASTETRWSRWSAAGRSSSNSAISPRTLRVDAVL